jgi:hypothetical protein
VSPSAVTVEFPNGNVVSYPTGFMFKAHPTNRAVSRLLRMNLIRQVTQREVPYGKKVDAESTARRARPVPQAPSPLQVATAKKATKKSTKKPEGGEE